MKNDYLLLMDGSSLLSTQFYGSLPKQILYAKTLEEKEAYFDKILQTTDGFYTNGVFLFIKYILKVIKEQRPTHLAVAWDLSRNTFRRELYQEYKGNRSETMLPLSDQFAICQGLLQSFAIPQFMSDKYEADDFCGTLANKLENDIPIFIMTKDNDYLQLINDKTKLWLMHSTADKTDELYKKYRINKAEVNAPDRCFVYDADLVKKEFGIEPSNVNSLKGIMGDPSDNIKGVPGIGEATATALIGKYHTVDALYREIKGKDKKEIDAIKTIWKEELGIKRSPISYLLKTSDTELVGEKAARLSEQLATIKKDIEIHVTLDDLKLSINIDDGNKCLKALEVNSIDINDFYTDTKNNNKNFEKVDNLPYSLKQAISNNLISERGIELIEKLQNKASSIVIEDKVKTVKTEVNNTNEILTILDNIPLNEHFIGFFINEEGFSINFSNKEFFSADSFLPDNFKERLNNLFTTHTETFFTTFNLKEQLGLLPDNFHENVFDLSVAHYLINPLARGHGIEDILIDYPDFPRAESISKSALLISEYLISKIKDFNMWKLYTEIEMPLVYTLFDMEKRGIKLEKEALDSYSKELCSYITKYEKYIYELAGEEFNINSPKQLGVILFEKLRLPYGKKTKTGYSTSADVLERIRLEDPIVDLVLNYRQVAKLKSTYTDGLADFIRKDGRIHCKFNQLVTATGRLSSTDPNLQNIPVRVEMGKKIRKAFVPKEGYVFIDADYSQIELRIMAHLSGDEQLIEAYRSEEDIHKMTASQVFGVPLEQVTSEQRRNAKAVNFGIIYGISSFGLGENLGISRKEAAEYIDNYFKTYPNVKKYLESLVAEAKKNGFVTTYFGRRRPVPELFSKKYINRQFGERVAMNSPIQGTAADIIKIAMINVNNRLKSEFRNSQLLLQIHDELLIEAEEKDKDAVAKVLKEEMMKAADLKVSLSVDVKTGYNWYDVH